MYKKRYYPTLWGTPHYMASVAAYRVISKYFGAAIERRLSADNCSYRQNLPYVINEDIYGQKIYPENLGYLPLFDEADSTEQYIHSIVNSAKSIYNVRDGYASFYFHSFLNPVYLKTLVEEIGRLGFTFVDLRK